MKTDKIDAKVLADLLAADLIPRVWIGDERTRMLRRLVSPTRAGQASHADQNEISAVLHRNLNGRSPASDPFGAKGRGWIAEQILPIDERLTVDGCLRQLDFRGDELAQIDAGLDEHEHAAPPAAKPCCSRATREPPRRVVPSSRGGLRERRAHHRGQVVRGRR